ncbi:MAG TPA: alkaline shock response membrane anchor protein AmaP [Candidatus Atribacteria bacterium]|nr:alkaline shock response membrane anchor protein AmaP [Candidatus Atribacteria bacterium]
MNDDRKAREVYRVFWGKLFALILAIISLLVAFFIVVMIFNVISLITIQQWLISFYLFFTQNIFFKILGVLVVALFVFLACALLRFLLPKMDNSIVYETPEGEIKISFNSLKALTIEALRNVEEVVSVEPEITKAGNEAQILLRLQVKSDTSVPDLSSMVQNKVREKIERQTGIIVKNIKLFVDLKSQEKLIENS